MKEGSTNGKTISAIAQECGVSAMTVSRALRNNSLVKEDTRKRIVATAERMGYIRSPRMGRPAVAGSESSLKIQLVAGTMGRSMTVFHSRLLISIEQHLSERGYECVIRTCNGEYSQFIQLLENVRNSDVDATMIVGSFVPGQLRALLEAVPEAILLDNPGEPSIEISYASFAFDNIEAARVGVRHLLDCGHRKILLVCGSQGHFFTNEIEQGYRETLECRKIKLNGKLVLHTDFTSDCACDVVGAALDAGLKFDAVFTNDEMASGVYRALLGRGLKIPQDVAVCGCDGLPVGTHLFPRLTTVILDYEELASMAVRHILEGRKDKHANYRVKILPVLEVRESTKETG
ncbi:MAG: LacI family DNA-binding transcriptional regulator [Victivallales bacterium]